MSLDATQDRLLPPQNQLRGCRSVTCQNQSISELYAVGLPFLQVLIPNLDAVRPVPAAPRARGAVRATIPVQVLFITQPASLLLREAECIPIGRHFRSQAFLLSRLGVSHMLVRRDESVNKTQPLTFTQAQTALYIRCSASSVLLAPPLPLSFTPRRHSLHDPIGIHTTTRSTKYHMPIYFLGDNAMGDAFSSCLVRKWPRASAL